MRNAALTTMLLLSFLILSACGRDENYSDTKKDAPSTSATQNTGAAQDTAKQSSTKTSGGAAGRDLAEKGKSGRVTSSETAEPLKTKETTAPSVATSSAEKSKTSNGIGERSSVATATRSDKDQTRMTKSQTIEGEVLKIEGESFLVKDISGKEVKLTADSNTKKDSNLTTGDRIIARIEDRGTLASINKR
jgi:hypothetical protein